jgi:type IV secretion system protein VirB4
VKLLLAWSGHQTSDSEDKEIFEAIGALQLLDPPQRRLRTVARTLPRNLGTHLSRWTEGEQYGMWFDHVEDTVSYARCQYIDMEGMDQIGPPLEPLLFYLFHRFDELISSPDLATVPKLAVVDEAWRFFRHATTRTYIETALRTWRKKNGGMILATQSLADLPGAELLRPIVDNCPTKFLLANPTLDSTFYGDVLQLTPTEQNKVRLMAPKRQFLLKRDGLSKVLNLNLDPRSYWLFTTNPFEAKRREQLVAEFGLEAALDILAGGSL